MGARYEDGLAHRRASIVHCCKSQSHYIGDECWTVWTLKIPPALAPAVFYFSKQCTVHAQYLAL